MEAELIRNKLAHQGFLYVSSKLSQSDPSMVYWRCDLSFRKEYRCNARVITKDGAVLKVSGHHAHGPSPARIGALRAVEDVKAKARMESATTEQMRRYYNTLRAQLPPDVVALLPSVPAMIRTLQRQRAGRGETLDSSLTDDSPSFSFSGDPLGSETENKPDPFLLELTQAGGGPHKDLEGEKRSQEGASTPLESAAGTPGGTFRSRAKRRVDGAWGIKRIPRHMVYSVLEKAVCDGSSGSELTTNGDYRAPGHSGSPGLPFQADSNSAGALSFAEDVDEGDREEPADWRVEENCQSHGDLEVKPLVVQSSIYEIRTLRLTGSGLRQYRRATQRERYIALRAQFCDTLVGHWVTEGHGVNQVVQLVFHENLEAMLAVRQEMQDSEEWQEEFQGLEDGALAVDNVVVVPAPDCVVTHQVRPAAQAVYELQILPEQNQMPALGSEAQLVGRFCSLYGPGLTEYRLLRYPTASAAFLGAYHRRHDLAAGSSTRLLIPFPSSPLR